MKKTNYMTFLCAIFLPLLIGMISAAISSREMAAYGSMRKPPLSPPSWVFSLAWTVLYLMMGLASYYIFVSKASEGRKITALAMYVIQLAMNFCWSILFFNWKMYLLAFFWLLVMWFIVIGCIVRFYTIDKRAAYLMIAYVLWLTFAAYLNLGDRKSVV